MPLLDSIVLNATCDTCHWWWEDSKGLGECHYNAPTATHSPEECWPLTAGHECCSKWHRDFRNDFNAA